MIRWGALVAVTLLAAAPAKDPLAGRIPGQPARCIDIEFTQAPQIVDQSTILFRETNKRVWRTTPEDSCPYLDPLGTLIVEQHGAELCQDDHFRVRRPNDVIPSPLCRFSTFTPYDKR